MMFDIDQLTESEKRELMLEIEELAQLEGLRNYDRLESDFKISADILNLIDSKADKTEVVKNDGTVSLTGDWDIGNGRAILADKIKARSASGLLLSEDSGANGIFITDDGKVGINISSPQQKTHIAGIVKVGTDNNFDGIIEIARGGSSSFIDNSHNAWIYTATYTFEEVSGYLGALVIQPRTSANMPIIFATGSGTTTEKMRITGTGEVGIGTTTPYAKLAINGGLHVGGDSNPGNDNLLVDGNVEIDGALDHDGSTVGFFGTTPVTKQSALTTQKTTIICSNPSVPDYDIADPVQGTNAYGFSTADEFKTVMDVIANLQTRLSELELRLKNYGLLQ